MHCDGYWFDPRYSCRLCENFTCTSDINAKFVVGPAGRNFFMRFGIHIWINADADLRAAIGRKFA